MAGAGGNLQDPGGNRIAPFAWGLVNVSNNIAEAYSLWEGVSIAREERMTNIMILGDSMVVVRTIIDRTMTANNAFNSLISRILTLLYEFEEVAIYHIKRELNSKANYWAKLGLHLTL